MNSREKMFFRMATQSPWTLQKIAREGQTAAERKAARTVLRLNRAAKNSEQRRRERMEAK